jgi:hypothetical protein
MKAEEKLRAGLPVTARDVRPMSVYDVVPPSGRAGIAKAQVAAVQNHFNRRFDAIIQRMDDHIAYVEELRRERRRRGR